MSIVLTRSEIDARLRAKWADAIRQSPKLFTVMVPSIPHAEDAAVMVRQIEEAFSLTLPPSFVDAAMQWDLGRLVLGYIPFAKDGNYLAHLLKLNAATPGCEWWGDRDECDARPADLLAIAHGDPFMVLLDIGTGRIYAHATDDGSASTQPVSRSLDLFLRGIATAATETVLPGEREAFVDALVSELGEPAGKAFWDEVAVLVEPDQ